MVALVMAKRADKKRKLGLCVTRNCRNLARPQRSLCNTCKCRKYEKPLRRLYRNLKISAARRKKGFSLSFEDFERLAVAGGYAEGHGRSADGLHVDRIDPLRGYEVGNIQFLTNRENVRKMWAERTGWRPDLRPCGEDDAELRRLNSKGAEPVEGHPF